MNVQRRLLSAWLLVAVLLFGRHTQAQLVNLPPDVSEYNVKDFGAVGDGVTDDTKAIQAALDADRKGIDTKGKLDYFHPFPKTVYFPKGIYLVSDKLNWTGQAMMLLGQGKGQSVILLKDNTSKFNDPDNPQPLIQTPDGIHQFRNYIRDLSIHIGEGNPGVVAVDFVANNSGGIVNVDIRSKDQKGVAAISMMRYAPGPCMLKNVSVTGFDYAIRTDKREYSIVMENIFIRYQKVAGIENNGNILTIRKLTSNNAVPAVRNVHSTGMITLMNSYLYGGHSSRSAIENDQGYLYARDVRSRGYESVLRNEGVVESGSALSEYVTSSNPSIFSTSSRSLRLPIEETPEYIESDLRKWAKVTSPGWYGDNREWQDIINSGKPVIYWPAARYLAYNRTYTVPVSARKLMGFGSVINEGDSHGMKLQIVDGDENSPPLIIEHFGYGITIEHLSRRPLVIKHCRIKKYVSSDKAGKLYLEDVEMHSFTTIHPQQKVFARQWNNEVDVQKIWNNGGDVWIFGIKTERKGYVVKTTDCGRTEVLGGLLYPVRSFTDDDTPAFICENAQQSLIVGTSCYISNGMYPVLAREKWNGLVKELKGTMAPGRSGIALHLGLASVVCVNLLDNLLTDQESAMRKGLPDEAKEEIEGEIYPNPATDWIGIKHPFSNQATEIVISDAQGKVIYRRNQVMAEAGVDLRLTDLGAIPAGMYILSMRTEHAISSKKLVINRGR
jgi:hypothetical protein